MIDDVDRLKYRKEAVKRFDERREANHPDGKLCAFNDPCAVCAPLIEGFTRALVESVQIIAGGATAWQLRRLRAVWWVVMAIFHPIWLMKNWSDLRRISRERKERDRGTAAGA